MKKLILLVVPTIFLWSCENSVSTGPDHGQRYTGNGVVTSQERPVGDFRHLSLSGAFNVYITQGPKASVKVEADENLQELVRVSEVQGDLEISMKDSISIGRRTKMNVYIVVNDLEKLETQCVGNVSAVGLKLSSLDVHCSSVGKTALQLDCERLKITADIVGELKLSGNAEDVIITHRGVGAVSAFGLQAKNLRLRSEGVGTAEVNASSVLIIDASGIGSVRYRGDPARKEISNTGIGRIVADKGEK